MKVRRVYWLLKKGRRVPSAVPGRYAGWRVGKIFGRLDCKSGMRMKPENRVFFLAWEDAVSAGYRPCKKCRPTRRDSYETKRNAR